MKSLFLTLLLTMFLAFVVNAQTFDTPKKYANDNGLVIDFGMASSALDSAAQDISKFFTLADYDGGTGNIFVLSSNLSTDGTMKVDIDIYGCETSGGTYVLMDNILANEATEGQVYTAFDMSDARAKYYKLYITTDASAGAALTGYHLKITAGKKDPAIQ